MPTGRRRNKYHNIKTLGPAPDGGTRLYDSRAEAAYAVELQRRAQAGDIASWKCQHTVTLSAEGKKICTYRADFLVGRRDGSEELHEVKGRETDVWKLKRKLLELYYLPNNPNTTLVMRMVERGRSTRS